MINIRKLVALDMALHGVRLITAEYAIGIVLPLILAVGPMRSLAADPAHSGWQALSAVWLIGVAANYIPLFLYAVNIWRAGTAKQEGEPEFVHARRYNLQQLFLFVPFLVAAAAFWQARP